MTWGVLGESVAGTSHRERATGCQDAWRSEAVGEWLVIAVADGAGSAELPEVGAALACEELVRLAKPLPPEGGFCREWAVGLFTAARAALVAESERRGTSARELACTALLAVVGPETAAFAQVGDGAIVVNDGPAHRTVFWPEPGEYVNVTDFLTDERFADALQFATVTEPVTELALLTDGLQRLSLDYATRLPHGPFFGPLFRHLRAASDPAALTEPFRAFLDSPAINARTDDDKTLVLALKRHEHLPAAD